MKKNLLTKITGCIVCTSMLMGLAACGSQPQPSFPQQPQLSFPQPGPGGGQGGGHGGAGGLQPQPLLLLFPQPQLLFFVETVEKNPSAVTGRMTLLRLPVGIVSENHIVDVPVLPQAAPDGVFLKFLLHRHWLFPPFCVKTKR